MPKSLEDILGLPKRHKPERAVKSVAAINFLTDGNLFIERFDMLSASESMENHYFSSKAFVDLSMSIECSLKSIIISLSPDDESPAEAYKKARTGSHKLNALYSEVEVRAKNLSLIHI